MKDLFINLYEVKQKIKELEKQKKDLQEQVLLYMEKEGKQEITVDNIQFKITPAIAIKYSIDTVIELYQNNLELLKKFVSTKNGEINKVIEVLPEKNQLEATSQLEQINRLNIKEIK